eukprot:IDg21907t1
MLLCPLPAGLIRLGILLRIPSQLPEPRSRRIIQDGPVGIERVKPYSRAEALALPADPDDVDDDLDAGPGFFLDRQRAPSEDTPGAKPKPKKGPTKKVVTKVVMTTEQLPLMLVRSGRRLRRQKQRRLLRPARSPGAPRRSFQSSSKRQASRTIAASVLGSRATNRFL